MNQEILENPREEHVHGVLSGFALLPSKPVPDIHLASSHPPLAPKYLYQLPSSQALKGFVFSVE